MQELIAEQPKDWLQLYVDAMTEKDPYKRLALVRQLRRIPRFDESDDSQPRTGPQLAPARNSVPAKPQVRLAGTHKAKRAEKSRPHLLRTGRTRPTAKTSRRSPRLRSA